MTAASVRGAGVKGRDNTTLTHMRVTDNFVTDPSRVRGVGERL